MICRTIFRMAIVAALSMGSVAARAADYATKRLAAIAATLDERKPDYNIVCRTNGFGEVEHIGLRLFANELRYKVPSATYDFLERHLLELNLYESSEQGIVLAQKSFDFLVGGPNVALRIDTTYSYSVEAVEYKQYVSSWSKDDKVVLRVSFAMDWQLMSGCNLAELETGFVKRLLRHTPLPVEPLPQRGTYIISPLLCNDIFMKNDSTGYLFSPKQMSRSISNLVLVEELQESYSIRLTVNRYDYLSDTLNIPLRNLYNFCRTEEGCVPYFALKRANEQAYEGLLIMANPAKGFMHMITVVVPKDVIERGSGLVAGRLMAYIPMHNVKPEYFNLTEYETIK